MAQARRAQVVDGQLTRLDATGRALATIPVGSPAWFAWLDDAQLASFSVHTLEGSITVRRERQRNSQYWYAYRKRSSKLRKAYVGKSEQLTAARLDRAVASLLAESTSPRSTPEVHLHLLGAPRVLRDDQPLALTVAKALALLGYLALHDAPQRRDHLFSLLWPESTAAAAHKNLRNTLWAIRTALGSDLLRTGERLALTDAVWVDVRTFSNLAARVSTLVAANSPPSTWTTVITSAQRALGLYRGPLLDGLELADAPDFELWLTGARERIEVLHMHLFQSLVTAHRALQHWSDVLAVARRAVEHDRLQEPMYRTIMEAHAEMGERAEALHVYDSLRATLESELGVEPLPETESLRAAILRGALVPAAPSPLLRPPARPRAQLRPLVRPLLGVPPSARRSTPHCKKPCKAMRGSSP